MSAQITCFVCDIFGGNPDPEALPVSMIAGMIEQNRIDEMNLAETRSEVWRDESGTGCVLCGDEEAPTLRNLCAACGGVPVDDGLVFVTEAEERQR